MNDHVLSVAIWMALRTLMRGGVVVLSRFHPQQFVDRLVNESIPGTGVVAVFVAVQRGARLAGRLKRFKYPDACYLAVELPARHTGKLNRGQLSMPFLAGSMPTLAAWTHH